MQLIWSVQARWQLDALVHYIAQDDIDAALYVDDLICTAAEGLCQFPQKGRIGRVEGTRELVVHSNYILVYCHPLGGAKPPALAGGFSMVVVSSAAWTPTSTELTAFFRSICTLCG